MPTFTLAGDESGDVSMSFGKRASRNFVIAMIATHRPDQLRYEIQDLREAAHLPKTYEFKFHSLTSARLRRDVFLALRQMDFSIWAVTMDKTFLPAAFEKMSRTEFYLHFVADLLGSIPASVVEKSTLILDEFGSPALVRSRLKQILLLYRVPVSFKRLTIARSRSEPLIQIADLVAGSILRRDMDRESGEYDMIARKIKHLREIG